MTAILGGFTLLYREEQREERRENGREEVREPAWVS
jgi:hypothetical protein